MNLYFVFCIFYFLLFMVCQGHSYNHFYAYYTKINSEEAWEQYSRTGEYADIVVCLNEEEKLVFWRGSSYLPYWETTEGKWFVPEVIPRSGDGTPMMPDKVNLYSHVRIIENTSSRVMIHWRYLPNFSGNNPKTGTDHTTFVDEYFTVFPNGNVTRTIRQGTEKWDEWNDPLNVTTQRIQLNHAGINILSTSDPAYSGTFSPVEGNPILGPVVGQPDIYFSFNDGLGNTTKESIESIRYEIEGHKSYWKKGVSGTALAFDGYTSGITIPNEQTVSLSTFSISVWVALGAYPWNWAPVVHQSIWEESGFYLGIDATGRVGLKVQTDSWNELTTSYQIPLREWIQITATCDGDSIRIFINGIVKGSLNISGELVQANENLMIGRNNHAFEPFDPVRPYCDDCHTPLIFSIDGIIDELVIYDDVLTREHILQSYQNFNPGKDIIDYPNLDPRILPTGPTTGQFRTHYTRLDYYDTWDSLLRFGAHADIVVEFDNMPTKFVFWRGTSYVPQVVNAENQWYNNQFNESWDENGSWGEPMSDKQCKISHVRLIEDTPARKVIHWRYAQVQINGTLQNYDPGTGWSDWSDWYYYIYPDGMACKRMVHWSGDNPLNHEWQESIGVMAPGQTPNSICDVNHNTVTLADMNTSRSYDWSEGLPMELEDDWVGNPLQIQIVNYNSAFKPFTIADFAGGELYGDIDERVAPYSTMVVYTHWPVGQFPSDGIYAIQPDRTSSNGYTHLMFAGSHKLGTNFAERVMLEGMTNKSVNELRTLARSWLNPAPVKNAKGIYTHTYDQAQRAYVFTLNDSTMSFDLDATTDSPVLNPCFVIEKWGNSVSPYLRVNGNVIDNYRKGFIRDAGGKPVLVIYLERSFSSGTIRFEIGNTGFDVKNKIEEIPKKFNLNQNFPNPFNSLTTIEYQVPITDKVDLEVFNILGQKVLTLIDTELDAGNYEAVINGANLSSGVYFYRLRTNTYVKTRKCLLMK